MHRKTLKFKKKLLEEWRFQDWELQILKSVLEILDNFHDAQDDIKKRGVLVKSARNPNTKIKNPALAIANQNWLMFQAGLKSLGITDSKNKNTRSGYPLGTPRKG